MIDPELEKRLIKLDTCKRNYRDADDWAEVYSRAYHIAVAVQLGFHGVSN